LKVVGVFVFSRAPLTGTVLGKVVH
jgi:hypothetical protein